MWARYTGIHAWMLDAGVGTDGRRHRHTRASCMGTNERR